MDYYNILYNKFLKYYNSNTSILTSNYLYVVIPLFAVISLSFLIQYIDVKPYQNSNISFYNLYNINQAFNPNYQLLINCYEIPNTSEERDWQSEYC